MMEQGSLADLLLFAFGGFGNGMFGRNMAPNGLDNANQLILES